MADIKFNVLQKPIEERLVNAGCIYWEVAEDFFKIKKKNGDTEKRHVLFYLLHIEGGMSKGDIAAMFSLHRSSIDDAVDNIAVRQKIHPHIARMINNILAIAANLQVEMISTDIKLHIKTE